MNDLNVHASAFQGDLKAVLDFISRISMRKEPIRRVSITKEKGEEWKVEVNGTRPNEPRKPLTLAGLYDLNW